MTDTKCGGGCVSKETMDADMVAGLERALAAAKAGIYQSMFFVAVPEVQYRDQPTSCVLAIVRACEVDELLRFASQQLSEIDRRANPEKYAALKEVMAVISGAIHEATHQGAPIDPAGDLAGMVPKGRC